ncbi:conserved hypothetical protein [Uncinocarpus reesii 1704]|uniref:Domain of unknown function at the cortex 1 domain-containing protein n=1 Tax=Uncinocarpus reesii (strain UAMH 1704) TaxID=336963 RepID=C4JF95_UNCRE|nr:uncharacterized protein UREG_02317 [Uncinocarpus reesii 1704]EEP77468.1 conserved hypothetical protein [Uncinocarpus reesii 1704]
MECPLTAPTQNWVESRPKLLNTYQSLLSRLEHRIDCKMRVTDHAPYTPKCRSSNRAKRGAPGGADSSTGLTPHILRTRLVASSPAAPTNAEPTKPYAKGKPRRHTTPFPQSNSKKRKLGLAASPKEEVQLCQYVPFSDIVDSRTRRRIARAGFSEEMNAIEERRRIQKKLEKQKDDELRQLKDELDRLKSARVDRADTVDVVLQDGIDTEDDDMDFDEGIDTFDEFNGPHAPELHCLPALMDAGTQVSFHSCRGEVQSLKEGLERKKLEQRTLFQEWQRVVNNPNPDIERTGMEPALSTPPPDLAAQVIASLRAATARADEAAQTVVTVQEELSTHGFDGVDAMEVITNIGARFRHARMELERAVPGETPSANLSNWSTTIDALVERIHRLVTDLKKTQEQVTGYQERETALRRQFDSALLRYEETCKKNENLEKYTETVAEDMLDARMKLQRLGKEIESHATDKTRLTAALESYRKDVKMLESLNEKLEDEITVSKQQIDDLEIANNKLDERNELSKARIAILQKNLSREHDLRQRLQSSLDQCNSEISNLKWRTEQLDTEYEHVKAVLKEASAKEAENHEKQVGTLNARLSSISTSLDLSNAENGKLQEQKSQLERRLSDFQLLFSREAIQTAQRRAKETLEAFEKWQEGIELLEEVSRREGMIREEARSFGAIGSEPITPGPCTRFKNVEMAKLDVNGVAANRADGTAIHESRDNVITLTRFPVAKAHAFTAGGSLTFTSISTTKMASEEPAERYTLKVTAGPTYDSKSHRIVPVNADETLAIETEHSTVNLCVRIQDYNGLPPNSPRTSNYFSHPDRQSNLYSIAISLVPKRTIPGSELVFGNDFDHPIRDRLPPGTNYALKLAQWTIDPGLEGDAYADRPYLYGAALSSWNFFRICEREGGSEIGVDGEDANHLGSVELHDQVIAEGSEGSGKQVRESLNIPDDADSRKKHFLDVNNRQMFEFEAGRLYKADFGNPYLGFSDFTLRLPGFSLDVAKYIDQKNHSLRYVLKNKNTGDIYFVVLFTLLLDNDDGDQAEEDGEMQQRREQEPEESEVD